MEIIQDFDNYLMLAEQIRKRQLDSDTLDQFKKILKKIAMQSYFVSNSNPEKEVLKKFFLRRERLIGNKYDEVYADNAVCFLLEIMNKENLTYDDLDYKKCRWFV